MGFSHPVIIDLKSSLYVRSLWYNNCVALALVKTTLAEAVIIIHILIITVISFEINPICNCCTISEEWLYYRLEM